MGRKCRLWNTLSKLVKVYLSDCSKSWSTGRRISADLLTNQGVQNYENIPAAYFCMFVEAFHTRSRLLFTAIQRLRCHDRNGLRRDGILYYVIFYAYTLFFFYPVLGKKHHLLTTAISVPLFPPELTAPQVVPIPFSFSPVAGFNTVSVLQHSWDSLPYFPKTKIQSYKCLCLQYRLKRFHCSSQRARERIKLLTSAQQLCKPPIKILSHLSIKFN